MKLIRHGVFETNSSSCHSISIGSDTELVMDTISPNYNGEVVLETGEFGWETEKYNDAHTKAQYLTTYVLNYCGDKTEEFKKLLVEVIKEQTKAEDVFFISRDDEYYPEGYIDHQSIEDNDYHHLFENKELLRNFIFNKNSWLFTTNDNRETEPSFYDVPKYVEDKIIHPKYKYELVVKGFNAKTKLKEYPTEEELKNALSSILQGAHIDKFDGYVIESNYWSNDGRFEYQSWILPPNLDKKEIYFIRKDSAKFEQFRKSLGNSKNWKEVEEEYYQKYPENVKTIKFQINEI